MSNTNVDQTGDLLFYSIRQSITPDREIAYVQANEWEKIEPPLLDELEIYPDRILKKSLLILNPFEDNETLHDSLISIHESDLAGPVVFCLLLGVSLFVAGSNAHFGYIYGLSMISVCGMYALLWMLSSHQSLTFVRVASVLGYGILPVVWLSLLNIFLSLNSTCGITVVVVSLTLSSMGTSRMLCLMTDDVDKRLLIAYPCTLIYIAFAFFVLFWNRIKLIIRHIQYS